ncbi:TPA: hypothetical protein I7730_00675 [Vibrio vulnificus]|uniref:Uncharacterized protein n=1 Tax=Vibrio vulnificus TaxID=672 RepID=A0A8H9K5P7_VIBVL|nr:hypothetical protein [Vibrio vulnificus]HAS8538313.1 hypothetical protein [Vibrio vulnificus]
MKIFGPQHTLLEGITAVEFSDGSIKYARGKVTASTDPKKLDLLDHNRIPVPAQRLARYLNIVAAKLTQMNEFQKLAFVEEVEESLNLASDPDYPEKVSSQDIIDAIDKLPPAARSALKEIELKHPPELAAPKPELVRPKVTIRR